MRHREEVEFVGSNPTIRTKFGEPVIAGSGVAHDAPRKQGAEVEAPGLR